MIRFIALLMLYGVFTSSVCHAALADVNAFAATYSRDKAGLKLYAKHWFGSLPVLTNGRQDSLKILIHDIFIIFFDTKKQFPVWVAYYLTPGLVDGQLKSKRDYILDPYLSLAESLTLKDYKGASTCDSSKKIGYDKGHMAPVGSFKNTVSAFQAQYLSNIVPQTRNLNQGPWRNLEKQVRKFVLKGRSVRILTGPLFGKDGEDKLPPCWKAVQGKIEEIPNSYWKIVAFQGGPQIKYCAFLFPQKIKNRKTHFEKYRVSLTHIEHKAGLIFFTETSPIENCQFLL